MPVNETLINVPGRLHSVASEHHLGGANEIYDDDLGKLQSDINAELFGEPISVLHSELMSLIDNNQLIPNRKYRITDYESVFRNEDSAGHNFDIVVLATSTNTISEDATAELHEGDTYFNDNIKLWKLKYKIDNVLYYAPASGIIKIGNSNFINRTPKGDSPSKDFPYCWGVGSGRRFTAVKKPQAGDTCNSKADGTGTSYTISEVKYGKGGISNMIDEYGNNLPFDFKNLLISCYKITGSPIFKKTSYIEDTLKNKIDIENYYITCLYVVYTFGTKILGSNITDEYINRNKHDVTIDPDAYYIKLGSNTNVLVKEDVDGDKNCYIFDYNGADYSLSGNVSNNNLYSWTTITGIFIVTNNSKSISNNNFDFHGNSSFYNIFIDSINNNDFNINNCEYNIFDTFKNNTIQCKYFINSCLNTRVQYSTLFYNNVIITDNIKNVVCFSNQTEPMSNNIIKGDLEYVYCGEPNLSLIFSNNIIYDKISYSYFRKFYNNIVFGEINNILVKSTDLEISNNIFIISFTNNEVYSIVNNIIKKFNYSKTRNITNCQIINSNYLNILSDLDGLTIEAGVNGTDAENLKDINLSGVSGKVIRIQPANSIVISV